MLNLKVILINKAKTKPNNFLDLNKCLTLSNSQRKGRRHPIQRWFQFIYIKAVY